MKPYSQTPTIVGNPRFVPAMMLILLTLAALGRTASYFYTVSATDIAFADWVPSVVSYAGELIVCARLAVSVGFFSFSAYSGERREGKAYLTAAILSSAADYAARFLIDWCTGAIAGTLALAGIWVMIQFVLEALLLAAASWLIQRKSGRFHAAETAKARRNASPSRANLCGTAVFLILHLVTEAYYLFDFLVTYTGITGTEIASIVGSFLRILVIYGGAAFLIAEGASSLLWGRDSSKNH